MQTRFLGNFADLTGYKISSFRVEGLAGRDAAGAPRWSVVCGECGEPQVVPHARAAALLESKTGDDNLYCTNGGCPLSRSQASSSETFAQFRKRERREAAEQGRRVAEAQSAAEAEAAKQRVKDAKLSALRAEYVRFWNHQIKTRIEESKIVTFDRWQQLTEHTRRMVLSRISADSTVYFEGL